METVEHVVFVHGLGEGPDTWDGQIAALPHGREGFAATIPGLSSASASPDGADSQTFSLPEASASLRSLLAARGVERAHVVGLSLGAVIAVRFAIDEPQCVSTLVLAAGQVKPPRTLMRIQSRVMRLVPERTFARQGVDKRRALAVLEELADLDVTASLESIAVPTLVLCGTKDRANLPASRLLASLIPDATLLLVKGAGHQIHRDAPDQFAALVAEHVTRAV